MKVGAKSTSPLKRNLLLILLTIFSFLFYASLSSQTSKGSPISGFWLGELQTFSGKLQLVLKIRPDSVSMDSPKLGFEDLAVEEFTFQASKISFAVPFAQGRFEGQFEKAENRITGEWHMQGFKLPLTFNRIDAPLPIRERPQTPKPPFPYRIEEVSYTNVNDKVTLAGTLTLPHGDGPFPAAILLSVAGENDRNQAFANHKPFMVLADALTKAGLAVLRADDRGVGGSQGDYFQSTYDDFAEDALAARAFLKSRSEIDSAQIGFIGHSEGTAIAAKSAAALGEHTAFIVLLGGIGVPAEKALLGQARAMAVKQSFSEDRIEASVKRARNLFRLVIDEGSERRRKEKLWHFARTEGLGSPGAAALVAANDTLGQVALFGSPWYRSQFLYDPMATFAKVKCPVLAITGSLDPVLPADENLPGLQAALIAGKHSDYTIIKAPGLNHLMQTARLGMPIEYSSIDETFSEQTLATILSWLSSRIAAEGN